MTDTPRKDALLAAGALIAFTLNARDGMVDPAGSSGRAELEAMLERSMTRVLDGDGRTPDVARLVSALAMLGAEVAAHHPEPEHVLADSLDALTSRRG